MKKTLLQFGLQRGGTAILQRGSTLISDIKVEPRWLVIFFSLCLLVFLFSATNVSASTINSVPYTSLNSGLVGLWSFDGKDMTNGVAMDRSGQGNNGSLTNIATSTFYTLGKIGQAGNFDGVNDYANLNADNLFDISGDMTTSFWFKTTSTGVNDRVMFGKHNTGSQNGWYFNLKGSDANLACTTSGYVTFYYTSSDITDSVCSGLAYNDGKWHHMAVIKNSSNIRMYVDGVLKDTSSTVASYTSNSVNPLIGTVHSGSSPDTSLAFPGSFDETRIYNRALSAAEITRLYQMGAPSKINIAPYTSLNTGLVGLWSFDGKDTLGGTFRDTSGQGNNCGARGIATSTFYTMGRIGQAGSFDGTNDVLNCGQPASLVFTAANSFSFSAWVNGTSTPSNNGVMGKWYDDGIAAKGYFMSIINPNGYVYGQVQSADGTYIYRIGNTPVEDGKWHHIIVTYSGTSNAATGIKIYVDGVEDTYSDTQTVGTLGTLTNTSDFVIGARSSNSVDNKTPFTGKIDETRVYNRALSLAEVKRLYQMGNNSIVNASSPISQPSGLIGSWSFNGPDALRGSAIDRSTLGNKGNIYNIATSSFYAMGRIGQAFNFDGSDDYIEIANESTYHSYFDTGDKFSFSAWVKNSGATDDFIMAKNLNSGNYEGVQMLVGGGSEGGSFVFYLSSTGALYSGIKSTQAVNDGKWHHLVATYSGTGAASGILLYIDGVAAATSVVNDTLAGNSITNSTPLTIGSRAGIGVPYQGVIDETKIYSRVLTPTEVNSLYKMGK